MDVFDQATELERLDRESALLRARAAVDRGGRHILFLHVNTTPRTGRMWYRYSSRVR